jgi:hypothetical protein
MDTDISSSFVKVPKYVFIVPYRNRIQHKYYFSTYITAILKDVTDPEQKRKIIGREFVEVFQTEAKKFDPVSEEYLDQRYVTFNQALFYNTQQTSGLLTLAPKQDESANYLLQQTSNIAGLVNIDRNERDWTMNSMRDIRVDYTVPMFLKDLPSLQNNYYIDKVVNPAAIDYGKDWTQLESFRDKFLVVRLIFDNFADTRLIFNFSALQRSESER